MVHLLRKVTMLPLIKRAARPIAYAIIRSGNAELNLINQVAVFHPLI
jgi:hypothetical protein